MNAVFERDFVAFGSSGRFLLLRAGVATLMALLFLFVILPKWAANAGDYGDIGTTLLASAVGVGAVCLGFAAPASFGSVFVHARAQRSLPILLASPMSATGIAAGAFLARAGTLSILVVAVVAPVALALLYGGVRWSQLFDGAMLSAATMLLLAAPSFVISSYARRTSAAIVSAYLAAAAVIGATWLLGAFVLNATGGAGIGLAAAVSPLHAFESIVAFERPDPIALGFVSGPATLLLLSCVASLAAVFVAGRRLRREAAGEFSPVDIVTRTSCRPVKRPNPVLDHELRQGAFFRRRGVAHGLLALLVLAEVACVVFAQRTGEWHSIALHGGLLAFEFAMLILAMSAAGATALAQDKETNILELIRAAPLSPADVVVGKLAGVLRGLLPCMVAVPALHLVWTTTLGLTSWWTVFATVVGRYRRRRRVGDGGPLPVTRAAQPTTRRRTHRRPADHRRSRRGGDTVRVRASGARRRRRLHRQRGGVLGQPDRRHAPSGRRRTHRRQHRGAERRAAAERG